MISSTGISLIVWIPNLIFTISTFPEKFRTKPKNRVVAAKKWERVLYQQSFIRLGKNGLGRGLLNEISKYLYIVLSTSCATLPRRLVAANHRRPFSWIESKELFKASMRPTYAARWQIGRLVDRKTRFYYKSTRSDTSNQKRLYRGSSTIFEARMNLNISQSFYSYWTPMKSITVGWHKMTRQISW